MSYQVNTLQTVADCDDKLIEANAKKAALLFKQQELQFTKTRDQGASVLVEAEVPMVANNLASFTTNAGNAPAGKLKDEADYVRSKAQMRLLLLKRKQAQYGTKAMLQKDYDMDAIAKALVDLDAFIAALIARKAELT